MSDKVQIETGVPLPISGVAKFPFDRMQIGDSILVEVGQVKPSQLTTLASAANQRYAPKKFTARRQPNGYRIWRIE